MKIIAGNKSDADEIIKLAIEHNATIITADETQIMELIVRSGDLLKNGKLPPEAKLRIPIPWTDLFVDGGLYGTDVVDVIYYNLERILYLLASQRNVLAVTMSYENIYTGAKPFPMIPGCTSCVEGSPNGECPESKRPCGHHCNHAWSHEECCWCGQIGETLEQSGT